MQKLLYIIGLIVFLCSCDKNISEFQTNNFIKFFGNGNGSFGHDSFELPDEGYIITGHDATLQFRRQVLVIRTDRSGNTLWKKLYGTEHNEEGCVVRISDNEIFIAGNKTNFITGKTEAFLMKLNLEGDSLAYYPVSQNHNTIIHDMVIENERVYIAGEKYESSPDFSKYFVVCLNQSGEIIWQRATGSYNGRQTYRKIFVKENGRILLTGTTNELIGSDLTHISIAELNSSGMPLGVVHLDTSTDQEFGDAYFYNNSLYVLHSAVQAGLTRTSITLLNPDNTIKWQSESGIPGKGTSMHIIDENKIVVTTENNEEVIFNSLTVSGGGNVEITELKKFPGSVRSLITTGDSGILATGSTSPVYGTMVRLIKTDAELYLLKP